MALPDLDAMAGSSFALELDGVVIERITEVQGLVLGPDAVELKANTPDGKYIVQQLSGRPKAGEVTFIRDSTDDGTFEKWLGSSRFGDARKNGAVIVYDRGGQVVRRYELTGMRPKSRELGSPDAGDAGVLTEKLVVTYENLEVE
ncbi:phage tail protein [Nocardia sp. NPDC006044]|uniref:phage tail protein n=1 Tax=Nocardia sp. NPDC006044 TaxID=3364306 RepID=UPI0036B2F344